jgi:beta-lactamase class D
MKNATLAIFILIFLAGCQVYPTAVPTPTLSELRADFGKYFKDYNVDGAFVLYDMNANQYTRHNPERCAQAFLPASTYKIVNALIALETGIASDADYVIKWDGQHYPIEDWNRDHTLRSAMKYSVVWYYLELAQREGQGTIQKYVDAIGYGNRDISGGDPAFWLNGNLRISANEQIDLLVRLYKDDLPFSKRSMDIVKDILVREKNSDYILRAKFGSTTQDSIPIGWYVGYLEKDSNVYFFATNVSGQISDSKFLESREAITINILRDLGILEEN